MNIGIDIDGVLTDYEREITRYGIKMSVEKGWKIDIDPSQYRDLKMFNWTQEQVDEFWNKYLVPYVSKSDARKDAPEIIKKLIQEGDKIHIITARDETGMPPEHYGKMQELTKEWLKNQDIKYDKLIFANDTQKLNRCIENKIDVMIEDSPTNIINISKEITVIRFDSQYNKEAQGENIKTAYTWYHIYDIINKMKK